MQGFNMGRYYPPDFDPSKGGLNKQQGKHPLGDRARKLDQGVLIVRFELPFNIWCGHCNGHIGQGVRYNAEKKKVGNYYSTPIYGFRCKCHLCQHWFEIRTDPENTRYVVHDGAKAQNQEWDPEENGGFVLSEAARDTDGPQGPPPDPFASLEKTTTQKQVAQSAASHLAELEQLSHDRWSDPFAASVALRNGFRAKKKVRLESEGRAEGVRTKYGLGERVRVEDLRTPARREEREEEDGEWARAREERRRREGEELRKRRREEEQVGWGDKPGAAGRSKSRESRGTSRTSRTAPTSATPRRGQPSSAASSSTKAMSPALQALAGRLRLASALKADPFMPQSSSRLSSTSASSMAGKVQVRPASGK